MTPRLLIVNPGSTSTKVAVFEGGSCVASETLHHDAEEIKSYPRIMDQFEFRRDAVVRFLEQSGIPGESLAAVVGRGGPLPPMEGGVYEVDDALIAALREYDIGHASSLGGLIAREIATPLGIPAFIADPVTTDELDDIARFSGLPEIERKSIFHALNQKAVARAASRDIGRDYADLNLILVHLGGGISVGAHRGGRVVEVANALDGDGPYSPERSGGLPCSSLVRLCFSGKYTEGEMRRKLVGGGGLVAYLGTNSLIEVEKRIREGDDYARLCYEGMAYQVAKEVGRCAAVLSGNVDAIILTGGAARSQMLVDWITQRVKFIAPVMVYPGENEMEALAEAGLRVLSGTERAKRITRGGGSL
ncbi:MAG: butyrate kinase [Firmicutes bacterium]|jgi:butyrate kinase|nr:butyrate kinase [Bacillota bacterium]